MIFFNFMIMFIGIILIIIQDVTKIRYVLEVNCIEKMDFVVGLSPINRLWDLGL